MACQDQLTKHAPSVMNMYNLDQSKTKCNQICTTTKINHNYKLLIIVLLVYFQDRRDG